MIVILAVDEERASKSTVYVAIGLTLLAIHFGAVPFSGSSVNPARSFGTALVGNKWTDFWIYIIAPTRRAILGWLIYTVVIKGQTNLRDDLDAMRRRHRGGSGDRAARGQHGGTGARPRTVRSGEGRPGGPLQDLLDLLAPGADVVLAGGGDAGVVRARELGRPAEAVEDRRPRRAGRPARRPRAGRTRAARRPSSRPPAGPASPSSSAWPNGSTRLGPQTHAGGGDPRRDLVVRDGAGRPRSPAGPRAAAAAARRRRRSASPRRAARTRSPAAGRSCARSASRRRRTPRPPGATGEPLQVDAAVDDLDLAVARRAPSPSSSRRSQSETAITDRGAPDDVARRPAAPAIAPDVRDVLAVRGDDERRPERARPASPAGTRKCA